jgi:hypothetical protein
MTVDAIAWLKIDANPKKKCRHADISAFHSETASLSACSLKAFGKRDCAGSSLKRKFCH